MRAQRLFVLILFLLALNSPVCAQPAAPGAAFVTSLWGGARESIALEADGTVWTWGMNDYGKLGIGTASIPPSASADVHVPVQVHGPGDQGFLTSVKAIMGGEHDNFALRQDGTVWGWGWNLMGMVGDGTFTDRYTPVQLTTLPNIVALGGRGYHALALDSTGHVWAWGFNDHGQLGHATAACPGMTPNRLCSNVPVQVDNLVGATAITGGGFFSLALMPGGVLRAWGEGNHGQLGNGNTADQATPVAVQGLDQVTQVSAGWFHAIALRSDGSVWTWGDNTYGELGYDTLADNSSLPHPVAGLGPAVAVSAGDSYNAVLLKDGSVWTWGENQFGQLGDGTMNDAVNTAPRQVKGLSGVVILAARDYHTMAVKANHTVWAWGSNENGECGDGTILDRTRPVQVQFTLSSQYTLYLPLVRQVILNRSGFFWL